MSITKQDIENEFKLIQDEICNDLERIDGSGVSFHQDLWERTEGGGGRTRIFKEGDVIEKGGVNFSAVHGILPDMLKKELQISEGTFFATGVSIVLHPKSPHVPIIHMNIRYFETSNGIYWFGGGIDLTPHYIIKDQAKQFHQGLKKVCDTFSESAYQDYKKWADDYFFIPHRNETRGIGGVFFDKLSDKTSGKSKQEIFNYVTALGREFSKLYEEQVVKGKELPFSENQKQWQLLRRGRYVEFNLVNDRGTKFGLQTNGRIESILMSLPKFASWEYNFQVQENSKEEETLSLLKKDINWI